MDTREDFSKMWVFKPNTAAQRRTKTMESIQQELQACAWVSEEDGQSRCVEMSHSRRTLQDEAQAGSAPVAEEKKEERKRKREKRKCAH